MREKKGLCGIALEVNSVNLIRLTFFGSYNYYHWQNSHAIGSSYTQRWSIFQNWETFSIFAGLSVFVSTDINLDEKDQRRRIGSNWYLVVPKSWRTVLLPGFTNLWVTPRCSAHDLVIGCLEVAGTPTVPINRRLISSHNTETLNFLPPDCHDLLPLDGTSSKLPLILLFQTEALRQGSMLLDVFAHYFSLILKPTCTI